MNKILTPSDIIHCSIVSHLVIASRNGLTQPCSPLLVLCYMADHVAITGATQYASFENMNREFEQTIQVTDCLHGIYSDFCVGSVDDFISKFETMRSAIEPNNQISHNNLAAPSLITADSYLGVFLRTVFAKWECLKFEEICSLHYQVQLFLRAAEILTAEVSEQAPVEIQSPFLRFLSKGTYSKYSSFDSALPSTDDCDVAVMESQVHRAFDFRGSSAQSANVLGFSEAKDSSSNLKAAVEAFMNSDAVSAASAVKHQHAMLRLAAMWLRANNLTMALSAVEEAMKTAHQRGDHRTVSHALLLLHSVFQHSQDPELAASVEDILMRCAMRSAALNLQHLTAQSALLLASLRSQQSLRTGFQVSVDGARGDTPHQEDQSVWHVQDVWSQMAFAQLGEIALTRQAVTRAGIVEDSEFTQSGPSTSLLPSASQSVAKKENLQETPLAVGPEMLQLSLQTCLVSCALWQRHGMTHMAEFTCRRGLAQFSRIAAVQDIIPLYVRLLYVQLDLLGLSDAHTAYASALALAKRVKTVASGAPDSVAQQVDGALLYVVVRLAQSVGDHSKALRLAARLVDTTAPLPAPARVSTVMYSNAGGSHGVDGGYADAAQQLPLCEDHVRARLLLAELLGETDPSASLQLLADLEFSCRRSGSALWECHCLYLRGNVMLRNCGGDPVAEAVGLGVLREALEMSQLGGFASIQNFLLKLVSNRIHSCT